MRKLFNSLIIILSTVLGLALICTILELPPPGVRLPEQLLARLGESGVIHPVTAVLLNFRGYDTLLEVAVLLLALLCVLAQTGTMKQQTIIAGNLFTRSDLQTLQWLARILVPLMILVSGYLLWVGAHRPGGAFQAGAVLAAAGVLLNLSGLLPARVAPTWILRVAMVSGLLIFLIVATAGMAITYPGLLLQYPPAWAGVLILFIEAGLTLSLGLILTGLFLSLSDSAPIKETEE
jgi:multisubunit Na+/H+ antiporter MnhB subunit